MPQIAVAITSLCAACEVIDCIGAETFQKIFN